MKKKYLLHHHFQEGQWLNLSLFSLVLKQFLKFAPSYGGALLCLYFTHSMQSQIPSLAAGLGELVEKDLLHQAPLPLYLALALGIILFRTMSRLLFFRPARILQRDLKTELISRIEEVHPSRYRSYSRGQIYQILQNDMDHLRAFIGFALLQLGNVVIALLVLVPKMINVHPQLIPAFLPQVVGMLLFSLFIIKVQKTFRESQQLQGEVQHHIIESYEGKKTIKSFHAEASFIELFKRRSEKELKVFYKAGMGQVWSLPLVGLSVGLSLLWAASIVQEEQLGKSTLIWFSGFVYLFQEPLQFFSWIGAVFARASGAWQRIKQFITLLKVDSPEEKRLREVMEVGLEKGGGPLDSFRVPFWDKVVQWDLPWGEWSVLIGPTGVGKSTLLRNLADYFRHKGYSFSLVDQHPYLFNDTLVANIFLGREGEQLQAEDVEKAKYYLRLFGLDEHLQMEIGENGRRLSGGQGKRLALVRSLMSGAEILLWDDPFSSVDLLSEKAILGPLRKELRRRGTTLIITSHRLSTVKYCDHLYYLDRDLGIMEKGSVSQILGDPGSKTYAYFQKQMA